MTISTNSIQPPYIGSSGLVFLLEIVLVPPTNPFVLGTLNAISGYSIGGFRDFDAPVPAGAVKYLYFGSEDFTSSPTDTVAPNRWYDGRLNKPGSVSRSASLAAVDGTAYVASLGTLELANGDGALDTLPDIEGLINSRTKLLIGERGSDLSSFQVLSTGLIEGVDVGLSVATLFLSGIETLLSQPWYDDIYAGTGGLEGPSSLSGVRKPYVLGRVFNMAPVIIDPLTYVYQAHASGPLAAVTSVSFGGVPMVFTADYPSLAALQGAALATGEYATCLADGLIRAGLTAGGADGSFTLTANVETVEVTASTLAKMVADRAVLELGVTINAASFAQMEVEDGGFYYGCLLSEPKNYSDVLSGLMHDMNRFWGVNRVGELTTARLNQPSSSPDSGLSWDDADIMDCDRMAMPNGFRWPHASRSIRFDHNWSVQTSLAAIVEDASYSTEYKESVTVYTPAQTHSLRPDPVVTDLRTETSAALLAQRLLDLHGVQRYLYSVKVNILSGIPSLLERIAINYNRFGLGGGKTVVVVAIEEDYTDETVLITGWA